MRLFTKLAPLAPASAAVANPVKGRQLSGIPAIPSLVCLKGALGNIGVGLLNSTGSSIVSCSAGEICNPISAIVSLPVIGKLLPIGVSKTAPPFTWNSSPSHYH